MLDDLLADEVVFRSPAVFAPQEGKALTTTYLTAALKVLGPTLRYVSQWHDHASAVLEFEADLDGVYVQGVDMLRWNAEPARPDQGLQAERRWRRVGHALDVVIAGGSAAGLFAALLLARAGQQVTVLERDRLHPAPDVESAAAAAFRPAAPQIVQPHIVMARCRQLLIERLPDV